MSSVPPKNASTTSLATQGRGHDVAERFDDALRNKDVGVFHVLVDSLDRQKHNNPQARQQAFAHLEKRLAQSEKSGTPMQHKEEVVEFLQKTGHARLEALTKEILHPTDDKAFQSNIAEAKKLLAAGYGGSDTAKLTQRVNYRSFGSADKPSSLDKMQVAKQKAKEAGATLKGAFHSVRKGVGQLRQKATKQASKAPEGGPKKSRS